MTLRVCLVLVLAGACSSSPTVGRTCTTSADCAEDETCVDSMCMANGPDAGAPPIADGDGDGISDQNEGRYEPGGAIDTDGDGTPDYQDSDSDDDGIPDSEESGTSDPTVMPADTNRDGLPDFRDLDSDGDLISDATEGTVDTDGDGRPDRIDLDSDGDGISDTVEGAPSDGAGDPADTDGDGVPDFRDLDSDADGLADEVEGTGDRDGDGILNYRDPTNDSAITPITFTAISTPFTQPIAIDYHEPTNSVVLSANYPSGAPFNFELIQFDGMHEQFSDVAGLTDEIKIGTVRSGNPAGFVVGDLFVGNGIDGQIVRVSDGGATITNPWVDLPGDANGLIRGSLYVDRIGVFGGELIICTTLGEVWRITAEGVPTRIAALGVHLEGLAVVPEGPARYGPLAGKILAGAEEQFQLYAISPEGAVEVYDLPVAVEDVEIVPAEENFFGVNFGTSLLLGAPASEFSELVGDILLTQEVPTGSSGLFVLRWNGTELVTQEIPLTAESAVVGQWEHVTFAPAGIVEVPPII